MNKKDKQFFECRWQEWVKRNPPSAYWQDTDREWAWEEMPCCGFLGKLFFELGRWLSRKK